jgi:hypothetical protein
MDRTGQDEREERFGAPVWGLGQTMSSLGPPAGRIRRACVAQDPAPYFSLVARNKSDLESATGTSLQTLLFLLICLPFAVYCLCFP